MARVAEAKTFYKGQRKAFRGAFGWNGKVRVETNPQAVSGLVNYRDTEQYTRRLAFEAVAVAKQHFLSLVVHSHPVTPPPYADSFYARKATAGSRAGAWVFGNDDPAAMWVEFGTHPGGGKTAALGYRPLGYAMDQISGRFATARKHNSKTAKRIKKISKKTGRSFKKSRTKLKKGLKKFVRFDKRFAKKMVKSFKIARRTLRKTRRVANTRVRF